jgi:hypothetical protein
MARPYSEVATKVHCLCWEDKLEDFNALLEGTGYEPHLTMSQAGDWMLSLPSLEIKEGGILSGITGRGNSPQLAVEDAWNQITTLPANKHVVRGAYTPERFAFRWNGMMFAPVDETAFNR